MPMPDPTYVREEIEKNRVWHLAWVLSEIMNDDAPIGWSRHISHAECLLANWDMNPKGTPAAASGWQPMDQAPKDGTWILVRGRNAVGEPMIPVVAAFRPNAVPAGRNWVDSASFRCVDELVAYEAPCTNGKPDWKPL